MPGARLPMRKLRELLRLHAAGLPGRQIGASVGIGQSTIVDYLGRARRAGIGWPLPDDMTDEALEAKLFPPPANVPKEKRPLPHWPTLHRELKRPGVTLQLLWEEHRSAHPDGYGSLIDRTPKLGTTPAFSPPKRVLRQNVDPTILALRPRGGWQDLQR